jgi:hypothetical protein
MLEIKRDTDIREVASLLGVDLKTAAELVTTCLLYEAAWKLCPGKAMYASDILSKYKPKASFFEGDYVDCSLFNHDALLPEEHGGFAYRYHFVQMNNVALVRDRKEHRWLIAELGELG